MSHKATNWAVQVRGIPPAAKVILWHLADRHNPDHGCFPSQAQLAEDAEVSRSTLNQHLALLEEQGLIRREQRVDERTRRQKSTRYILAFEPEFAQDAPAPCAETGHGETAEADLDPCPETGHGAVSDFQADPCPISGESRVRPVGHITSNRTSNLTGAHASAREDPSISNDEIAAGFYRFVAGFPGFPSDAERVERIRVAYAEAVRGGVPVQWINDAARAYAVTCRSRDSKFIARPESWIEGKRWTEHPPSGAAAGALAAQRDAITASRIREGKDYLVRHVTDHDAARLVAAGLVTVEDCRKVGLRPDA